MAPDTHGGDAEGGQPRLGGTPLDTPSVDAPPVESSGGDVVTIAWDNSSAQASIGGPRRTAKVLVEELGLSEPRPILLIIGGADSLAPEIAAPLERLLERGALHAAARAGATVIDGGTDAGVMALVGRASVASDAIVPLVGVAPCGKVGDVRSGKGAETRLEPNHSAFLLSQGDEWDDATSLLFDAIEIMGRDMPVAVVVAGGGQYAADEVHIAAHRAYPIVAIAGTDGVADVLAGIKQPADVTFAEAGRLAEVGDATDLTIFQLHDDPMDLEGILARHLRIDETLQEAWTQQRIVSSAATRQQNSYRFEQTLLLILGVLLTYLVVARQVLDSAGLFTLPEYAPVNGFLRLLILIIPIVVTTMAAASNRMRPGTRWVLLRGTSESVKAQIFQYRTRAGAYSRARTRATPREVKLAQVVGSQMGALMRTDVNLLGLPEPASDRRGPRRARKAQAAAIELEDADDKLSRLTPRGYVTQRIEKQIAWYRKAAAEREREARRLRYIALAFGAIGTFFAAVGLDIWVAVTTALVGAYATYLQVWQLETSIVLYNQAGTDLAAIRAWWLALPPSEQNDQDAIDDLVERAERIMRAENTGWVQEMQDAMTHLRLEQGADNSVPGAGRRRAREASRGRTGGTGTGTAGTGGTETGTAGTGTGTAGTGTGTAATGGAAGDQPGTSADGGADGDGKGDTQADAAAGQAAPT